MFSWAASFWATDSSAACQWHAASAGAKTSNVVNGLWQVRWIGKENLQLSNYVPDRLLDNLASGGQFPARSRDKDRL